MTIGVGVLGTENGSDLKYTLEVTAKGHLLVKLGALSKTCILFKILKSKNVCTTL